MRAQHSTAPRPQRRALIDDLVIEYGSRELLGRYFLEACRQTLATGIRIVHGTLDELVATNRAHRDAWFQLQPTFDPACGVARPDNAFCLLGVNDRDEVVATQAAVRLDLGTTPYATLAENLTILYSDPKRMARPTERSVVTSRLAREVTGCVAHSGAVWCRPDYRKRGISKILPFLGKAYALSLWNPDTFVTFMIPSNFERGLAQQTGFTRWDYGIEFYNSYAGDMKFHFLTHTAGDLLGHIEAFLAAPTEEVDGGVLNRRG